MDEKGNVPVGQGWSEGGPVESLSPEVARAEIKSIEAHPDFLGNGNLTHWPRQQMLRRRDALYRAAYPEGPGEVQGMAYELTRQGVTQESLDAQIQKYEERDAEDEMEKGRRELDLAFGGRERTVEVLKKVQGAVKTWTTGSFVDRLYKARSQNDPLIVQAIHTIIERIDRAESEIKERRRRRGGKG